MDFAALLAKSSKIELVNARGKTLARLSLAGANAALRYIDDRQHRVGTVTALVARGSATSVPPAPRLPLSFFPPVTAAPPAKFGVAEVQKYNGDDGCGANVDGFQPEASRLDDSHTLVTVPAIFGNGAYNYFVTALIVPNAGTPVTRARFDAPTGIGSEAAANEPALVNASYDQRTRLLSTFAKGRGLADCGVTQDFAWDGSHFRLVKQAEMGECRGSIDYITTWRAAVR